MIGKYVIALVLGLGVLMLVRPMASGEPGSSSSTVSMGNCYSDAQPATPALCE
jgi:hypothetical protein